MWRKRGESKATGNVSLTAAGASGSGASTHPRGKNPRSVPRVRAILRAFANSILPSLFVLRIRFSGSWITDFRYICVLYFVHRSGPGGDAWEFATATGRKR